jgi:hypothetical protein
MKATAALSRRCRKPVYHLAVYFRRRDSDSLRLSQVITIANHLLEALALSNHQYILVTPVPVSCWVVNVLVNIINPRTLTASSLGFDYLTLSRAAEAMEERYGLLKENVRLFNNLARKNGWYEAYLAGSFARPGYSYDDIKHDVEYIEEIAREEGRLRREEMHWVALRDYFWRRGYKIMMINKVVVIESRATGIQFRLDRDDRASRFLLRKYEDWVQWRLSGEE